MDVDPEDDGAGVGHFPSAPNDNCGIFPSFLPPSVIDSGLLSADAQRNLTESQEYQMLLSQLNAVAENIVARSAIIEHNEVLNNDDAATEAEVLAVPSPGRKRSSHEGANRSSSSKKRFLEIAPPSLSTDPLLEDASFQSRLKVLTDELLSEVSLRPTLSAFSPADVKFTAYILVRGGLDSVAAIKLALPLNRKYLLQDLRDDDLSHRDLVFLLKIFETFPPTLKNRNTKHPEFEEVRIPLKLSKMSLPLSTLPGLLVPDQRMTNEISELLARGQACSPAYFPFVVLPLNKEPWIPSLLEHKRAQDAWNTRMKSFASDQPLSFQSWIFYRLRFVLTAEVVGAWAPFGGLIAQINNIGVTLNIAVSENVGVALKYFDFLHAQLELSARSRAVGVDYFRLLSEEQLDIRRRFAKIPSASEGSSGSSYGGKTAAKGYSNVFHLDELDFIFLSLYFKVSFLQE